MASVATTLRLCGVIIHWQPTMSTPFPRAGSTPDELLLQVRRHAAALTITLRVGDELGSLFVGARLRRALLRATEAHEALLNERAVRDAAAAARFCRLTQGMRALLDGAPTRIERADERQRLARWVRALGHEPGGANGPDLYEVNAHGRPLTLAEFDALVMVDCALITNLQGARFVDTVVERCDLTYAALHGTSWINTSVSQTSFREAGLGNATFHNAFFMDCDFRDADFTVGTGTGAEDSKTIVQFARCDLRGTRWHGRRLVAQLLSCKVDGASGAQVVGECGRGRVELCS